MNLGFLEHQQREDRRRAAAPRDRRGAHRASCRPRRGSTRRRSSARGIPTTCACARTRCACAAAGIPVELYADLPYAVVYGWPHWVTGDPPDPHLDVDAYWGERPRRRPRVVALDDDRPRQSSTRCARTRRSSPASTAARSACSAIRRSTGSRSTGRADPRSSATSIRRSRSAATRARPLRSSRDSRERHEVLVLTSDRDAAGAPRARRAARAAVRRAAPARGRARAVARRPRRASHARRRSTRSTRTSCTSRTASPSPRPRPLVAAASGKPVVYRLSELFMAESLYRGDRYLRNLLPGQRGLRAPWARCDQAVQSPARAPARTRARPLAPPCRGGPTRCGPTSRCRPRSSRARADDPPGHHARGGVRGARARAPRTRLRSSTSGG